MDVSIIIVSYNTKELLEDCLNSIKKATKNLNVETFIVDNNSFDETPQMVKEKFPHVNVIANKDNVGFSKANNQAIKKAKGNYLLILNPDTTLEEDTLIKMKEYMDKNQEVGIATCKVVLKDGSLDEDCRRSFPSPWVSFCYFSGLAKLFPTSKLFNKYHMGYISDSITHQVDSCVGAFMMIKKSTINEVGMFDEDFFFYGEDLDLCWRVKEAGYKIMYTPITKITHHKGASSGIKKSSEQITKATKKSKQKALKESTRAMELFYNKHYKAKYPIFITWVVLSATRILSALRLLTQ